MGTRKLSEAVDLVQRTNARPGMENYLPMAADMAFSYIWGRFPWKETLADFPPFYLVPGWQDYYSPYINLPSDFDSLWRADLVQMNNTGNTQRSSLRVKKRLSREDWAIGPQNAITVDEATGVIRLDASASLSSGAPWYFVEAVYKQTPTKITNSNVASTTWPWDDEYFSVFIDVLRWKIAELLGSPAAGNAQLLPNGAVQWSGQAAVAMAAVDRMAHKEDLLSGQLHVSPDFDITGW